MTAWRKCTPIGNLGDKDPENGARFVYGPEEESETRIFREPYMEVIEKTESASGEVQFAVFLFELEPLKIVKRNTYEKSHLINLGKTTTHPAIYLVTKNWQPDWPHPVHMYDEWFHKRLENVAKSFGVTLTELRICFCSDDPMKRAFAWCCVGDYFGFDNFDSYPLILTKEELNARYTDEGLTNG